MNVELIDHLGDDLRIVNAARVSYARQSSYLEDGELSKADKGLLHFLARERHGTPFEQVVFTFRVKVPIGVAREWQRHRMGSFNEVSTRYVEMSEEFYRPDLDHIRGQVGKPGEYRFEPLQDTEALAAQAEFAHAYEVAYDWYKSLLDLGVAKELARNVLPLGTYTEFYWTVNFRSLTNFLSLRTAPNALLEIREAAGLVEAHVKDVVPEAYQAWVDGGRKSL